MSFSGVKQPWICDWIQFKYKNQRKWIHHQSVDCRAPVHQYDYYKYLGCGVADAHDRKCYTQEPDDSIEHAYLDCHFVMATVENVQACGYLHAEEWFVRFVEDREEYQDEAEN